MDAANASAIPESHYLMLQKKYAPPPDIVDVASAGGGSGDDVDDDGGGNGNDLDDDWLNEDLSMEPIDTEEDEWKPYLRKGEVVAWNNTRNGKQVVGGKDDKPPPSSVVDVTEDSIEVRLPKHYPLFGKGKGIIPLRKLNRSEKDSYGDIRATKMVNPAPPKPAALIATEISFDPYRLNLKTKVDKAGTKTLGLVDVMAKAGLETSRKGEAALALPQLREFAFEQLHNLHAIQGTDYHRDSRCFEAKRAAMAAPRDEPKQRKKAKTTSDGSSWKKTPVTIKNALKRYPDSALSAIEENGSTFVRCDCCQFVCRSEMSKLKRHMTSPTHQSNLAKWKVAKLSQANLEEMVTRAVDKANAESDRTSSLTSEDITLQAETMKACLASGISDSAVFSGPLGNLIKNRTGLKLGRPENASRCVHPALCV